MIVFSASEAEICLCFLHRAGIVFSSVLRFCVCSCVVLMQYCTDFLHSLHICYVDEARLVLSFFFFFEKVCCQEVIVFIEWWYLTRDSINVPIGRNGPPIGQSVAHVLPTHKFGEENSDFKPPVALQDYTHRLKLWLTSASACGRKICSKNSSR